MSEILKSTDLFWRAEDATCVLGGAFTNRGTPDYSKSGKFGYGAYTANGSNSYTKTINLNTNFFTLECWCYFDYTITSGQSDGYHWIMGWEGTDGWGGIAMYTAPYYGYTVWASGTFDYRMNALTVSTPTLVHLAYVVNRDGIEGGTDRIRQYINGVDSWSSTTQMPAATATSVNINVGGYLISGTYGEPLNGLVDNLKIYNNFNKTDFSDRFNERGGMNDQIISI